MKIEEVRDIIEKYSQEQLTLIVTEIYKTLPKAIKEDNDIDSIIKNPEVKKESRKKTHKTKIPDIKLLENETVRFVENAYNQYYLVPNTFVSKRERSKWRFLVKRLFKELSLAASIDTNLPLSSQLLEKLYILLCYSCGYILFTAYDPFQSVGIEQYKFFHRILSLKFQHEDRIDFITNALLLMINNSLNRYTLYIDLMYVILEFLKTPDMREMTIKKCSDLIETVKNEPLSTEEEWRSKYDKEKKLNNLTEMGFLCYSQLYEYDEAISYFKMNYNEKNSEIALYILLNLLYIIKQKKYFLREYEIALKDGILPRENLKKMYNYIKEKDEFPEYSY